MTQDNAAHIDSDVYVRLINLIVEVEGFDLQTIVPFAMKLPEDLLVYFLEQAPVTFYPYILQQARVSQEQFQSSVSNYILELVRSTPPASIIKSVCTFKFAKFYDETIIESIILVILTHAHTAKELDDIAILCGCIVQLTTNCARECNRFASTLLLELSRKLSSLFAKRVSVESPTYRHLRAISKMYAAVSKTAGADYLQYFIASFVSHIAQVHLGKSAEDQIKMRLLQSASFPMFDRCSKKQLSEVSVGLHDSHRQIFRQLHERWVDESQYRGKV